MTARWRRPVRVHAAEQISLRSHQAVDPIGEFFEPVGKCSDKPPRQGAAVIAPQKDRQFRRPLDGCSLAGGHLHPPLVGGDITDGQRQVPGFSHILVWMEPGLMALTVIEVSLSSRARFSVRFTMAVLAAS